MSACVSDYGRRFNIDSIDTPQLVVDGAREVIGSDRRAIEKALLDAIKAPQPALNLGLTAGEGLVNASASGPGLTAEKDAELWFALNEALGGRARIAERGRHRGHVETRHVQALT